MRQLIKADGTRIPIEDGDRIVRINTVKRYRMHKVMPRWWTKLRAKAWTEGGFTVCWHTVFKIDDMQQPICSKPNATIKLAG